MSISHNDGVAISGLSALDQNLAKTGFSAYDGQTLPSGGGGGTGTLAFLQATADDANSGTYTFAGQSLGAADADRYIIVTAASRQTGSGANITGITIGGVAATVSQQLDDAGGGGNSTLVAIAIAAVPTGTSGSVVVTYNNTQNRAHIAVYRATSLVSATPTDTAGAIGEDVAIDIPNNGFVIGVSANPSSTAATWSGLSVEDYDVVQESFFTSSAAHDSFPTSQSSYAISCDTAGGSPTLAASWALNP